MFLNDLRGREYQKFSIKLHSHTFTSASLCTQLISDINSHDKYKPLQSGTKFQTYR